MCKKETDIVKSEQAKGLILEKMMITYKTREHLVQPLHSADHLLKSRVSIIKNCWSAE